MKKTKRVPVNKAKLLDPNFKYVPSVATDIRKTFAKFGFVPPSEVSK